MNVIKVDGRKLIVTPQRTADWDRTDDWDTGKSYILNKALTQQNFNGREDEIILGTKEVRGDWWLFGKQVMTVTAKPDGTIKAYSENTKGNGTGNGIEEFVIGEQDFNEVMQITFGVTPETPAATPETPPAATPVATGETSNTQSVRVRNMQEKLNQAGYTDQNGNALAEDGMLGPKTRYAAEQAGIDPDTWNGSPEITPRSSSEDGESGEHEDEMAFTSRYAERFVGGATSEEIKAFQKSNGLEESGVYDEATEDKIISDLLPNGFKSIKAWADEQLEQRKQLAKDAIAKRQGDVDAATSARSAYKPRYRVNQRALDRANRREADGRRVYLNGRNQQRKNELNKAETDALDKNVSSAQSALDAAKNAYRNEFGELDEAKRTIVDKIRKNISDKINA